MSKLVITNSLSYLLTNILTVAPDEWKLRAAPGPPPGKRLVASSIGLRQKVVKSTYVMAVVEASPTLSREDAKNLIYSLLPPTLNPKDDRAITQALEFLDIESTLSELRDAEITRQVTAFMRSNSRRAALTGLLNAARSLTDEKRALLRTALAASSALETSPGA